MTIQSFKTSFKFISEILMLLIITLAVVVVMRVIYKTYEKNAEKKLTTFAPDFMWPEKMQNIDSSLLFEKVLADTSDLADFKELKEKKFLPIYFDNEERFETESEGELFSVETLPQNFYAQNSEESYKQSMLVRKEYRDELGGAYKIYRLIMRTSNLELLSSKIGHLINKYKVTVVNSNLTELRPKNENSDMENEDFSIGNYFHLQVSIGYLKEFLASIGNLEDYVLYVGRTSRPGPIDRSKVFIWIKTL